MLARDIYEHVRCGTENPRWGLQQYMSCSSWQWSFMYSNIVHIYKIAKRMGETAFNGYSAQIPFFASCHSPAFCWRRV